MEIDDLRRWAAGSGLEILLIIMGSMLLGRLVRWFADRLINRADSKASVSSRVMASEESKHKRSLLQVVAWVSNAIIGFIAGLVVIQKLNIPLTSIVAPATVLGAALGFGSQRVVQDLLSGFFLFTERQYGIGDVVRISPPGTEDGITGTVEEVTLRSTRLRTVNGEVVILPNGQILQVTNLSRNWAQVVLDIPLAPDADLDKVTELLDEIGKNVKEDEHWTLRLVGMPKTQGVEGFGADYIKLRFVARTLPGAQWDVSREFRRRIIDAFRDNQIDLAESYGKELV